MAIREVREQDYQKLVRLYKQFFPVHNVFQKDQKSVISYLREEAVEREAFLVDSKLNGALIIVLVKVEDSHARWKFRHFAFKNEKVGKALLKEAEKRIKTGFKTNKIELNIAESEPGKEFYLKNGYEQEGALKNHYRLGETCYVLGKSLP